MSFPIIQMKPEHLLQAGLSANSSIHYQLSAAELTEQTLTRGEGSLNDTGALCIYTGEFTGRSPQDKFIVKDIITEHTVNWNNFNNPIDEKYFHQLRKKMSD